MIENREPPEPPAPPPGLKLLIDDTQFRRPSERIRKHAAKLPELGLPYEMSEAAAQVFADTVAHLTEMKIAHPADVRQIAAYAECVVIHQRATRLISQTDILVKGSRSLVVNKAVAVQRDAAYQMLRFAQEFGLTPSARSRVEVDPLRRSGFSGYNPFAG